MVRINLLPAEIVERRKYERYYPYVFVVGAVLLGIVLLTWVVLQFMVAQRNDQLQQTEEAVTALNEQARSLAIFEQQRQVLVDRQAVATSALAQRVDMGKILEEIALVLPDPLWVEDIALNEVTGAVLKGYTPDSSEADIDESYKSIAAGMVRLNSLEDLNDVWLTSAESDIYTDYQGSDGGGERKAVGFEASAKIVKPASDTEQSTVPAPPSSAGQ